MLMADAASDSERIEAATKALYASICFEAGGQPSVERLRDLFMPDGRLMNNNGAAPVVMSVDDFIAAYEQQRAAGHVTAFYEGELSARTELFGKIAHRFSTYEAKFDLAASEPFSVGINSIQFIKVDDRWRVASMVWNDETETLKIPQEYL